MTTNTSTYDLVVINVSRWTKTHGGMTGSTIVGSLNVRCIFPNTYRIVVTINTLANHLSMIHTYHRFPGGW